MNILNLLVVYLALTLIMLILTSSGNAETFIADLVSAFGLAFCILLTGLLLQNQEKIMNFMASLIKGSL